jgi:HK97 family phage prohead protease
MAQKPLSHVEIKSADRGEFSAVFSTFNVKDSDGDVTLPGAFEDGAEVLISSYGHTSWQGALPVGKGTIRQTKSEAVVDGQFFMDTTHGRDTFQVVKALGANQQWSYGFDVVDAEPGKHDGADVKILKRLKVHEVSPVLIGAGVNTRTLAVKSLMQDGYDAGDAALIAERALNVSEYRAAIRPHEVPVTDQEWSERDVIKSLEAGATIPDLRSIYAWADPNGDPEMKSTYLLPHHHGPEGEANLEACQMAIWLLNNGKSGIPEADRQAVYAHLASHLQDGEREPLELRALNDSSPLKFREQIVGALVVNDQLIHRASEVVALRAKTGKSVAAEAAELMEWWYRKQRKAGSIINSPQDEAAQEYLRFIRLLHEHDNPGDDSE